MASTYSQTPYVTCSYSDGRHSQFKATPPFAVKHNSVNITSHRIWHSSAIWYAYIGWIHVVRQCERAHNALILPKKIGYQDFINIQYEYNDISDTLHEHTLSLK